MLFKFLFRKSKNLQLFPWTSLLTDWNWSHIWTGKFSNLSSLPIAPTALDPPPVAAKTRSRDDAEGSRIPFLFGSIQLNPGSHHLASLAATSFTSFTEFARIDARSSLLHCGLTCCHTKSSISFKERSSQNQLMEWEMLKVPDNWGYQVQTCR